MEFYKQHIEKHQLLFNSLVSQHKGKGKFVLARMIRNKDPITHIMTHIKGKDEFVDERMAQVASNQLLFLLKFGKDAVYLILTEEPAKIEA